MDDGKLVRMANQIADYFRAYPEADAVAGVGEHITAFWSAKMRGLLAGRIAAGTEGIDPLVIAAFAGRAAGESPILKEVQGPGRLGQMTSDAG